MVGLTEYKNKDYHYFEDSKGRRQGAFKWWFNNGQLREHSRWLNDELHGEYKFWNDRGTLIEHVFWVRNEVYRDLIKKPVCSDEEKFLIALETGAPWLD